MSFIHNFKVFEIHLRGESLCIVQGDGTITLDDVMVLEGYSHFRDPVFSTLEDQEMGEVEQKLILARQD
ncbi:hypothetical protein MTR_6g090525 [Medicago truncatula]|uniref:Uncharacterized protein n=1 Tax=Medicago truncatula TaxID=3880 RepID=A0A072UCQ3_MEDTR|nr:hypothetical protein MTR_6g090525 [Medicago truncatula]